MIDLEFRQFHHDGHDVSWDTVATLRVDGARVELEGDQDFWDVRDIEVLDPQTGRTLTVDADPVSWARNLPQAFRAGDLRCVIVHDSAPGSQQHVSTASEV